MRQYFLIPLAHYQALCPNIWLCSQVFSLFVNNWSQYAGKDYRCLLGAHGLVGSMSRKGNCWDNVVAESFLGSLKQERVQWRSYQKPLWRSTGYPALHKHVLSVKISHKFIRQAGIHYPTVLLDNRHNLRNTAVVSRMNSRHRNQMTPIWVSPLTA